MSLIVVGSVAFDRIETPFGKTDKIIGGAGTYISLAASYFNTNPGLISVVGDDFSQAYFEMLHNHDIDTKGVQVKKGRKSFFWSGRYYNDMNSRESLATELNVLGDFNPVIPDEYQDSDFLMLGNLSPLVQSTVIERLNKRPKLIVLDTMNFWMNTMLSDLKNTISKIDVLTINDEEARQLSGEYSLVKAAKKIQSMGPRFLIIKKGEHGALLFGDDEIFFAPALPLADVFDPTGAGDSFAGGFIGYLVKNNDISFNNMKNAVIMGTAMASFTVEKFGTQKLQNLDKKEIYNRVQRLIELVKFDL